MDLISSFLIESQTNDSLNSSDNSLSDLTFAVTQ